MVHRRPMVSHTLKKKKKKKNRCRWSGDPALPAVGGETSQLSHWLAQTG